MDMRISIALIKITLNVKLKLEVQPVNQFSDLKGEVSRICGVDGRRPFEQSGDGTTMRRLLVHTSDATN